MVKQFKQQSLFDFDFKCEFNYEMWLFFSLLNLIYYVCLIKKRKILCNLKQYFSIKMNQEDAAELRRQKILQNKEKRLELLLGKIILLISKFNNVKIFIIN